MVDTNWWSSEVANTMDCTVIFGWVQSTVSATSAGPLLQMTIPAVARGLRALHDQPD